nr:hypothetical protein SYMBAF_100157 [Serratia symbiotica]
MLFESRFPCLIGVVELKDTPTALTAQAFVFGWAEILSVNIIGITTRAMNSNSSHKNTLNNWRRSQHPTT